MQMKQASTNIGFALMEERPRVFRYQVKSAAGDLRERVL